MTIYDLLKEYGYDANDLKARFKNKQIELNGEVADKNEKIGFVKEVFSQGFFMEKLYELPFYPDFSDQLIFIGIENLIHGESNIKNEMTEFLKDYNMLKVSKTKAIFFSTFDEKPEGDTIKIQFHVDTKGKYEQEYEIPEEKDESEVIDKLKADIDKVEKQLSNPGFVNNAPKFKVDAAKNRLETLKKKLADMGVNESKGIKRFKDFN